MTNTYWSESAFLRPLFISDEVWEKITSNFLAHVNNPVDDLPAALADDIDRLRTLGFSSSSALAALRFEIDQAADFGSLAERGRLGSMGQGWSSLADIKLAISDQGMTITGSVDANTLASLNATSTAQCAVSFRFGLKSFDGPI